jgi:hypothetical protein
MYVTRISRYIAFGIIRGFTKPRYVLERITRGYGDIITVSLHTIFHPN